MQATAMTGKQLDRIVTWEKWETVRRNDVPS
jgi:hypothetical protein